MPRELPANIAHPAIPEALAHLSIPLQKWKDSHPNYVALMTGAFIFRKSEGPTPTPRPELLLLQRASTDSYPNFWEPPGGSVDLEDETILHGLVREVWEETGLRVKAINEMVWDRSEKERQEVVKSGDDAEVKFPDSKGRCKSFVPS